MGGNHQSEITSLRSRTAGADAEDPYDDVDISSLPVWWQEAIMEFAAHDMRPYRPPQFADGVFKHEIVEHLETKYNIDITFMGRNVPADQNWEILVDGETIKSVNHYRHPDGYSVFDIESDRFERVVRHHVGRRS